MDELDLNLLLLQIPGVGNRNAKKLLNEFGILFKDRDYLKYFIEKSYSVNITELFKHVYIIKEKCHDLGVKIIINKNPNIPDPPLVLYLKGDLNLLNSKRIVAIAGTRTPSLLGESICRDFAEVALNNDVVLVTGFARGCDYISQELFIQNNTPSIAVLPMGYNPTDSKFTKGNNLLYITEYSPLTRVEKYKCVNRNRIISGISRCLFIPEIKKSGGSYHTIKYAQDKGIPIAYGNGELDSSRCNIKKLNNSNEFDLFIKKSLK